jgi:hypothetical protein
VKRSEVLAVTEKVRATLADLVLATAPENDEAPA